MSDERMIRLSQAARELKVGIGTITEVLATKGFIVENQPNSKITQAQLEMLAGEFGIPLSNLNLNVSKKFTEETITPTPTVVEITPVIEKESSQPEVELKEKEIVQTDDVNTSENNPAKNQEKISEKESTEVEKVEITAKLPGLKVIDKIDLNPTSNKKSTSIKIENEPVKVDKVSEVKIEQPVSQVVELVEKEEPVKEVEPEKPQIVENQPQTKEVESVLINPAEKEEVFVAEIVEVSETKIEEKNITETISPQEEIKTQVKPEISDKDQDNTELMTNPLVESEIEPELIKAKAETLKGLNILGKIELPVEKKGSGGSKPIASSDDKERKKRKRKKKKVKQADRVDVTNTGGNNQTQNQTQNQNNNPNNNNNNLKKPVHNNNQNQNRPHNQNQNNNSNSNNNQNQNQNKPQNQGNNQNRNAKRGNTGNVKKPVVEITDKQIQDQIKATLAKLSNKGGGKMKRKGFRKDKDGQELEEVDDSKLLRVIEFISANDLATLMDVSVNDIIKTCISMGMFVSINQRLDAEAITFIADEFGYEVEFISAIDEDDEIEEVEDDEDTLQSRAPIVTVMGHVDHGKTSLLDYIRRTNVASGESGGITQHIGAYDVVTDDGRRVVFLDTPGHEAFTAMRARGAKLTDVVILVVAADDNVMPQTKEAINHARVANVPIVIAINKVDKPTANPAKIREELAGENVLVESWGGKYQDQEISAKSGLGIEELLEKVLLEAEVLELKANPNKPAVGTVIEASLDKGRGYVVNILVQAGTLKVGDIILVGSHYGKVKAMNDHRGKRIKEAGPSTPVQVLGLDGAPQAGDTLKVMTSDREAREIATKREQILREQNIRATKGLTLEEIGRRKALKNFTELKLIVKGDVDGSVEALSDSLQKLSTEEIAIKIIHKAVGQISEADILLASASEAIIVGFQVRPSPNAKRAAEQEKVQIKLYSIIYNAINEIKDAMEGLLAPTVEEVIVGNAEVREAFKISKVGMVAGCMVTDGYIKRTNKVRLIRDGIVTYEGEIGALKRYKEDVGEVKFGYECGMSIKNFNDIKVGDIIESFEEKEIKRTL